MNVLRMPPSLTHLSGASGPGSLQSLLQKTFGHSGFRTNQRPVCEAAAAGRDVLLVMPTGAGKSLCYQLPALARGGTALVISPLIALMDDQAGKLSALGLAVARIHSGLSREDARQACRDYLAGKLDFLFIAPERLRVPGFPEMLARRKPALVAIDEAHCISAWGHDFRPDYRSLGEHLPALRPAPVIALTATATPAVQRDIVTQLALNDPALFIHGFRRENLAIEAVEMSKPQRNAFAVDLLKHPGARPAIVYAPSRKAADELAGLLGGNAAAYHAGLDGATRERVQRHFLAGKVEIVVATIAFGMGIDKADVRTVLHTSLPASVEAYYQEIGRAGRDGLPSRTVLLHSFADRKMHEFFLERDYPAAAELARVHGLLTPEFQSTPDLGRRSRLDPESVSRILDKLASQGAAAFDIEGNVRATGSTGWRTGYDAQLAFRRSQIDRMAAFAEARQCRMLALIQHFGDTSDDAKPCGLCDFCNPTSSSAQSFREPTGQEQSYLRSILRALEANGRSTGKLFTDLALTRDRKQFDSWLDGLARAGYLTITSDSFISRDDGRSITYKKAVLTHEGRNPDAGDLAVTLRDSPDGSPGTRGERAAGRGASQRPSKASLKADRERITSSYNPAQKQLEASLRDWRKAEAGKTGKPAFMVFGDSTLGQIVLACPTTIPALAEAAKFNPDRADRYGPEIIALCRESQSSLAPESSGPQDSFAIARAEHRTIASLSSLKAESPAPSRNIKRTPRPPARVIEPFGPAHPRPVSCLSSEPVTARAQPAPPPDLPFTPAQQALEQRLRTWRAAEAERSGMPQFLVLPASTLRAIVLGHPRTLDDLQRIESVGPKTAARHGLAILKLCSAPAHD